MKFTKIKSIYKKEMLDLLRDKKTLIMMVLVPLLLYPLIMMGSLLISSAIASSIESGEYTVAIVEKTCVTYENYDREELLLLLEESEEEQSYKLKVVDVDDPMEAMMAEELDTYIVPDMVDGKLVFETYYLSSVTNSSAASDMVSDKLEKYEKNIEKTMLEELGIDAEKMMNPVEIEWVDKSSKEENLGSLMGMILPFLLITSILMGAIYPAIDTTAGEKERGTLETLLTLPVRNDELIMGKFLAVSTVSVVSALLNLVSMGFMSLFLYGIMSGSGEESANIDIGSFIPALVIVVLCVVAFAMFISAICMCVTTFAKSYKEANNYSTPLLLVVMLTGYIGFIPNIEFTPLLASVPVVNICLLINNILMFKYDLSLILIVLITNVAYSILAVWALSKIYNSEDVLFGEGGVSLQIFTSRKELKKGGVPNFSDALLVTAVCMLLMLYVGTILQTKSLMGGTIVTQLMIVGIPLLAAWYTKKDFKETFSIKMPKVTGVIGAILLELGGFIVIMLLSSVLSEMFASDAQAVNEQFDNLLDGISFATAFAVIAVCPAICEEILFRGYILSATKKKFKPAVAIFIVALFFGIYHTSFVKLFTTGLLGAMLAYVVYKSGSVILSMIMHFINNAISVVFMYYPEKAGEMLPILVKEELSVTEVSILLIIATVLCVVGIFFVNMGSRKVESSGND